jgi:hypothetical protein
MTIWISLDNKQPPFRIVFTLDSFTQYVIAHAESRTAIDKSWQWLIGKI